MTSLMFINRDLSLLAPFVKERVESAIYDVNRAGYKLRVFEAFRSPERQNSLYAEGRTKPGKIITNAKAWQSWHQYGVAVDVAYFVDGKWTWDGDFKKPAETFVAEGFTWLSPFEQVHFQLTSPKLSLDDANIMRAKHGIQAVWSEISRLLAEAH